MLLRELRTAERIALEAGAFLLRGYRRFRSVRYKGNRTNPVTNVDTECEERILRALKRAFPSDDFYGEETTRERTRAERRWYVDPLDGTVNFMHALPIFCVSIALQVRGRIEAGVVYCPTLRELYSATRGGGATCNRKPIRVSTTRRLRDSFLVTGFPYTTDGRLRNLAYFNRFIQHSQAVRRLGSAAMDLCWTAAGVFDGFWEFALGAWDIAAGMLIVSEAGGRVTDFRGGPVDLARGEILATNGRIHRDMLRLLKR